MSRLRDLYRNLMWLSGVSALMLPVVILTQPASYTDGLLLSVVLASTFFTVMGAGSWVGVYIRRSREAHTGHEHVLTQALRQGFVMGLVVIVLLLLQLLRVITPIDALLVVGLGIVIELYLGSRREVV